MGAKSDKNGIEGQPDAVLNIADVTNRGGAILPLLFNHITVSYRLEGAFVVLLAHENLVGRVLEVVKEAVKIFQLKVGLKDIEYKFESSSGSLLARGLHRGCIANARWVLVEH